MGRQAVLCSLYWQKEATSARTRAGSVLCSKPTSNLTPFTVSSDRTDFWVTRGETANVFTSRFTFWAHREEQEGTTEYTVAFQDNPVAVRIYEGGLSVSQGHTGWRRMFSFWGFTDRQPGTSPVSVKVETHPYRINITRGENVDLWEARSFVFWAYMEPQYERLGCDIDVVVDTPLWEHYNRNMAVIRNSVNSMVNTLNQLYEESIFSQY